MHKFVLVLLITIILKINYLNTHAFIAKTDLEVDSLKNERIKRQEDNRKCVTPNIPYGKIENLISRTNDFSYLVVNITCHHNYILYPPNNNIINCVNGFWDQEIPQCIQCGQRADYTHKPLIVNGTLSKFGDFPWHVGIYKKEPSNTYPLYICGGSIINDKAILSVAHCFTDDSGKTKTLPEYFIGAGKYYSNYNSDKDKYAQKRQVARIDIHPRYKGYFTNYAWDIAVIIVDEPFEISSLVQPICVDWKSDFENEQLKPNHFGEIAGWGATETNLVARSLELRVLKVPVVQAEQCTNLVPNTFIRYITPDKFCAGYANGSSVCGGDSGGGLVFQKQIDKDIRFYIRGLVSVGVQIDGRCDDYKYSTYTRVSEYLSFIQDSISNKLISTTPTPISTTTSAPCLTPNGQFAKCISIYKCQTFLDVLRRKPTAAQKKYMADSRCGSPKEITVCCGTETSPLEWHTVTAKPFAHKNLNLLPSPGICGNNILPSSLTRSRPGNIGNTTKFLEFPWLVLLEYGSKENSNGYRCNGFLINDRYVLTAGYCAQANATPIYRASFGEYGYKPSIDCPYYFSNKGNCTDPRLSIDIEEIIIHPLYEDVPPIIQNDIALVRLAEKVNFTDYIKPICLPLNKERSLPGKEMAIAGWGKTNSDGVLNAYTNQAAFLPAITDYECAKIYKEKKNVEIMSFIRNKHICAGGQFNFDACSGYIGGPLMSEFQNSQNFYAEGIISLGTGNCGERYPSVSTKVSEYLVWILDNIRH